MGTEGAGAWGRAQKAQGQVAGSRGPASGVGWQQDGEAVQGVWQGWDPERAGLSWGASPQRPPLAGCSARGLLPAVRPSTSGLV